MEKEGSLAARRADQHRPRLIAYANKRLGPDMKQRLDAEDIVQSAMWSFIKYGQFPDNQEGFRRLLYHFVSCKCCKHLRTALADMRTVQKEVCPTQARPAGPWEPEAQNVNPITELIEKEMERLCEQWWARLRPDQQQAVELSREGREGPSQSEIARRLGVSERTVHRYRTEAEEELRTLLGLPPAR